MMVGLDCNFSCFLEGGSPLPPGFVAVVGETDAQECVPPANVSLKSYNMHHLGSPSAPTRL